MENKQPKDIWNVQHAVTKVKGNDNEYVVESTFEHVPTDEVSSNVKPMAFESVMRNDGFDREYPELIVKQEEVADLSTFSTTLNAKVTFPARDSKKELDRFVGIRFNGHDYSIDSEFFQ